MFNCKIYNVGIYIRLSRDDEEKKLLEQKDRNKNPTKQFGSSSSYNDIRGSIETSDSSFSNDYINNESFNVMMLDIINYLKENNSLSFDFYLELYNDLLNELRGKVKAKVNN